MSAFLRDEHLELKRNAREVLARECTSAQVLASLRTSSDFNERLWNVLSAGLSWTSLLVPESYEGFGLTPLHLHGIMHECGRHLVGGPLFATIALATPAIMLSNNVEMKQHWLPKIASGHARATVAIEERGRALHSTPTTTATVAPGGFTLRGEKAFVVDGDTADVVLVSASLPDGSTDVFVVPADAPGLTRTWRPTMDMTRRLADVGLHDVHVREAQRLFHRSDDDLWRAAIDLGCIALCAEQVGGIDACLDLSTEYAKTRTQFGRAIGSFQAVQHMCADMLVSLETATAISLFASDVATKFLNGTASTNELAIAASSAKAYCAKAYFEVASNTIQVHGGIGFTWEHPAHLYFKRAKATEVLLGEPSWHLERVAASLPLIDGAPCS